MSDLHDYMFLYLTSLFMASLKIAQFIDWSWWIVGAPVIIAFVLHILVLLTADK